MRRGFCATLLVVGCALLLRSACFAQITFIPGPTRSVPRGPNFAAAADFNNDGIADAAISNTIASKISVLFGSPDGVFESAIDRQVGALLRGIATGDFNGDRNQDIAVLDTVRNRVYILAGDGNGTFDATGNFITGGEPFGVAVGNFDNNNGPDLATTNRANGSVTTFFNLGRNTGFTSQPNVKVGRIPKPIGAADFNGDGLDDLVLVNTGARGTDQLTILLNNSKSFQSSVPTNFVVGAGARALTIADFNNDGAPDVAVLNSQAVGPNTFSISILLNQTTLGTDGKPIGTGFFSVLVGAQLTCPARINLTPVTCTPQDIESGDFDRDGFIDLVVSTSTLAADSNSSTSGFITAFAGRGNGTFDFATQVLVGLGPRQMAVADFTGDGSPDITVTEYGQATVRILRSVPPPPKPNGGTCMLGTQCQSTFCVDNACCATQLCPEGEVCNIPAFPGQCHAPIPNGQPCSVDSQCESGFCVDGACCSTPVCSEGEFCNTGQCGPPAGPGTPCTDGAQCTTGSCVDRVCCSAVTCPGGQRCDVPGSEGVCTSTSDPGTPCTDAGQCTSAHCVDGVCCLSDSCTPPQVCNAPGSLGVCAPPPTRTATPTATPTPQPTGAPCSTGTQCASGFCVNSTCCSTASCPNGQRCDISDAPGMCESQKTPPGSCSKDTDCTTGNCEPNTGQCGLVKTATPTPTQTPRDPGASCGNATQCPDGYFCSTDEKVCCTSASCASDGSETCKLTGDCLPRPTQTPTPTPRQGPGQSCDPNNSDVCDDGLFCDPISSVCCETDTGECLEPNRCDIFLTEGQCAPPLGEGDECQKNTDCEDPLLCAFNPLTNQFECTVPPEPSPTIIPFTPAPTALPALVNVSRSGGCSIEHGPDGAQLWVLCLLPVALWLRRRGQHLPVRSDRHGRQQ
jgi:FG-GAP-like repeat